MKPGVAIAIAGILVSALPTLGQTLSWTIDGHNTVADVGGITGRTGAGAAVLGNNMYVLYTSANDPTGDSYNDQYLHVVSTNGSTFTADQRVNALTGTVESDANPSVTVSGSTIYLAINSQQSPALNNGGGFTDMFQSTDGFNYSIASAQPGSSSLQGVGIYTLYSPSLTTDPATGDIYLGLTNSADFTLIVCRLPSGGSSYFCHYFPGTTQIGYNPSLVYWNGVLYIGFVQKANSHNLDLFTSTDQGQTISEHNSVGSDQSSSNPSLAIHNNVLYYGFRSNDSSHNFLYKYSTNGTTFSSLLTTNNTKLGGAPMMVDGAGLQFNSNLLWNFNSANDSTNWLWWESAN